MMNWRIFGLSVPVGASALVVTLFLLAPVNAIAQDSNVQAMVDRLERLERDIRTLNAHLSRGGEGAVKLSSAGGGAGASGPAVARMGLRMDRLEQDLRSVTGIIEEVNHRILQVGERLDKLVSDVDFRLNSVESRGAQSGQEPAGQYVQSSAAPTGVAVQPVAPLTGANAPATLGSVSASAVQQIQKQAAGVQPAQVQPAAPVQMAAAPAAGALPAGTPKEQYTYAFNLLQQTNYDQAEVALKSFIETNADDPLSGNARYWLGETYYVRSQFQNAAQTFYEGYQKNPTGPKAADSLLKLGMSLAGLGKKDDACSAFAKVLSDFSKASASVRNAVARENKRNGCS
jgi:tol-pal system protein YbgF